VPIKNDPGELTRTSGGLEGLRIITRSGITQVFSIRMTQSPDNCSVVGLAQHLNKMIRKVLSIVGSSFMKFRLLAIR